MNNDLETPDIYLAPAGLIDRCKEVMEIKRMRAQVIDDLYVEELRHGSMLSSDFDGHICMIPKGRLKVNERWFCMECDQRWKVASRWNRLKHEWELSWRMYGQDIFTVGNNLSTEVIHRSVNE